MNPFDCPPESADDTSQAAQPRLVVRSPVDLIAAVPYMLGFHPEASIVAVGFDGSLGTSVLRLDLPRSGDVFGARDVGAKIAHVLTRNGFRSALLVGYGSDEHVTPVVTVIRDALTGGGLTVPEMLRVDDGYWWSYVCTDPACCPPEGTPYDISSSVVAARATVAGHVALADRGELARSVEPMNGSVRHAMRQATERAEQRLLSSAADAPDQADVRAGMVAEGVPLIEDLLRRARSGGAPATDDETARLGVLLTNLRVRDEAWVRIEEQHSRADLAFWRDVLRRVEIPYAAAPGCLLAYAAYSAGDGGLANVALDRATDADPDYSMARLLRDVIAYGVPPSKARLAMTPEQLAAAYDEQDEQTRRPPADQPQEVPGDERRDRRER